MAPVINGRKTGTVPKIKTHNDSSHDYAQSRRREPSFNAVPNNLVTLEWQPASDMRQSRTRKTSNTPSTSLDYCDFVPDMSVPQENSRYPPSTDQQDDQGSWGAVNRYPQEMNGHSEGSTSTLSSSRRSRTPRNVLPDRENKSSNINRMPDRNQVVSHLNQIQDYIKQTSTLMDTLKNSGEPRHQQQYVKLSKMIAELKESERRLQGFLPELTNISQPENDQKVQDSKSDKCTAENSSQASCSVSDHHGVTVNSNTIPLLSGGVSGSTDSASSSRFHSDESGGAVLKSSDPRRNELKMKVDESQRRLQALQDHQTALMALQQKAQDQLKEARVAQGILMARAVGGVQSTAPSTPPLVFPATEEHTTGYVNENSNSQTSTGTQQNINNPHLLQGNMQHLANRLRTLQELYENRNELVQMLGERDEELVSEHMVLQDKLQELQYKKQHMDHLVAEFQALNSLPGVATGSQIDGESSKNESEDGDTELLDSIPDYQVVRDKIAELNMMKAQLAQLKGIMSEVQNRGDSIVGISQNGNDETLGAREEEVDHEDQAVNLRRQKRDKSKGMGDRAVARSNSNTSAASSNKPDNIVQASSEVERARDIQHKTVQLQEAKARLQHLQDLLAAVSDFHSHGQPVPDQYLQLLNQEASKEEGTIDQGRDERQTPVASRPNTQSIQRERTPVRQQVRESVNGLPDNPELSLEAVQAMTRDLRQQTLTLQEERQKLISARKELGKLQRQLPLREKKTNTQVDAQTHQQMLLQAELQAKRHELEELMRKDQGQTSAINQDICSEASADKSETPGYSYLAEGTTNATWGGSTQGTLDDLAEQDNDIQEQSVGYSSDEGQDEDDDEEEEDNRFPNGGSQQLRLSQLNNNSINNNKDPIAQPHATPRDLLSMSMDSARISLTGNINSNHSNSTSIAGSLSQAAPASGGSTRGQRQCQSSHNVWRKGSTDSGTSAPRAVWTPSSQQARQENLCTAEELVSSSNNLDTNNSSSSTATLHNASSTNVNPNTNWCQQQVLQLQHQLELTSNLYQSMLHDQAHLQQHLHQQHGNNLLPAVGSGNNMFSYWSFPPPPYLTPPPPPPLASGGIGHLLPTNDACYQHLLAASQLQQQQVLLTTVNQCCHLLWLQQREMMALRAAIHTLQEKTPCGNGRSRGENYSPPILIGQPDEAVLITSNQNSAQPTPHQSQSNLTRLQQTTTTNPSMTTFSPHQNLKLSYSGGLFQSPEDLTGSSGVTSAHSLPNLSQATTSASSVFSPHHTDTFPSNAPLNNVTPTYSATPTQSSTQNFPTGTLTLTFPMNNGANVNNRTQQQPLSSLIQCSAPQPGSCAPWLQQGAPGGTPGLLQGHTAPSPVPALNNQVPPGNRANNYWDNFRSYSRQNLLSTSTKSNEGASHIPSPLVDRSHNTLRGSVSQSSSFVTSGLQPSTSVLSHSIGSIYSGPEQNGPICNMPRKEKLNTDQYQNSQDNLSLPGPSHNNMSDTSGLHYQLIGTLSSSSSGLRSRNQHNGCDFQLQPSVPRPRDSVSQDVPFQTTITEGCDSSANVQLLSGGQHNFSPVPEFHLGSGITLEARNISLQDQQNIILASDVFTLSQNKQGGRGEEESENVRTSKSQGKAAGITKKKNPKVGSRHNCRAGHDVPTSAADQKYQVSNALFEALSESVYTEVAALISANENRPHFLIQLFRDLQMISSDPLRQRILQSIQEVVSRQLASETADSRKNAENHQSQINSQQSAQNDIDAITNDHIVNGSMMSSDDETAKNEGSHHLAESLRTSLVEQPGDIHCSTGKCSSRAQSIAESEEGAVALLPSSHSSPRSLPRNAVWNMKDGLSLPSELPGRTSKLDWEVQAVLVDLLPFLKAHLDETCSTSLLEAVRRFTLQLVPAQNMSVIASPPQHSPQHTRLGCCYEVQLDALLEDALLKFQGCRLGDISEELLTVVAEVLLSELTFLRLVDTVSRGDNNSEDNEECCKKSAVRDHDLEEHSKNNVSSHQPSSESTQNFMASEQANHNYHEPQEVTLGAEAYNGDLAEADQSHHEESVGGLLPDLEVESAGALSLVDKDLMEMQNNQSDGTSIACMDSAIDVTENGLIQAEGIASDRSGDFNTIELNLEEEWEVEQDREQGLDRVPTRLSTEQQRPSGCSGRSTPERDTHNMVPHPGNQTDVPGP